MRLVITLLLTGMVIVLLPAQPYTLEELIEVGLERSLPMYQEEAARLNAESSLRSSWYGLL
ncbi:MAG: hypothetical protein JW784_06160, partial [Candidatus Cloacimonetes bacterium]|nr:hypothetical protein [Candidatus Cloacimonadota bacterium]